jgi:hypothetical protein
VPRYDKDGGRVATTLFEAAAWHYGVQPVCDRCGPGSIFHPHSLWWHFERRGWDDSLNAARAHFWCLKCGARLGKRIRPGRLDLVPETDTMICLEMPSAGEWKKAVNRFRS